MPRQRRHWVPGQGAHIISRFVDRRFYLVDDDDRHVLLDAIERADKRWDWEWLSYAAMSSHVHYANIAGNDDPDRFFRSAHTRLATQYHRRRSNRTLGPVFADRPKIYPVAAERLARLVAYHHRNPVRAGVVLRPSQSTWTSHRAYLRLDPAPPWLDVERALSTLGFRDTAAGRRRFDEFVTEVDLDARSWEPRRSQKRDWALSRGPRAVDWAALETVAREITGVSTDVPLSSRRRCVVKTRALMARFATRDLGQPYAAVAERLGIRTGSVFNLLERTKGDSELEMHVAVLRRCLGAI